MGLFSEMLQRYRDGEGPSGGLIAYMPPATPNDDVWTHGDAGQNVFAPKPEIAGQGVQVATSSFNPADVHADFLPNILRRGRGGIDIGSGLI